MNGEDEKTIAEKQFLVKRRLSKIGISWKNAYVRRKRKQAERMGACGGSTAPREMEEKRNTGRNRMICRNRRSEIAENRGKRARERERI